MGQRRGIRPIYVPLVALDRIFLTKLFLMQNFTGYLLEPVPLSGKFLFSSNLDFWTKILVIFNPPLGGLKMKI